MNTLKLTPPRNGKILLHCCCASCSSAILECMLQNGLEVSVFFSNSNIVSPQEYEHRKQEIMRYCADLGVECIDDDYNHSDWLKIAACGRENEPERGSRCLQCFEYRLRRSAKYALEHGFSVLTTSLASSRWKSLEQVDEAGRKAVEAVDPDGEHLLWWNMNWRKGGLQPRRNELIKELNFYNQTYCGCEFSGKMTLYPEAKINLGLNIIARRPDGFHNIETLFYPVPSLHDVLEIAPAQEFSIEIEGCTWNPEKDLCAKAYRLMVGRYGIGPVSIKLKKQIPVGAGLGGGSSDCAATIKALNRLFSLNLQETELESLASELGADCAFFIKGRPQWGSGKGEVLEDAPQLLDGYEIRVEIPEGESVSTVEAYKGVKPQPRIPGIMEVLALPVEQWKGLLVNDFEDSVFKTHPHVAELKDKMYADGAVYASMSGSGAAVFGIFKSEEV